MIVTMTVVRMMEASVDKIVDVVAVRDRLVSATRPVGMIGAGVVWRAMHGVGCVNCNHVLIDMISMHAVQMTVVQVISVAFVLDRRVPAAGAVLMGMVGMFRFSASRHGLVSHHE